MTDVSMPPPLLRAEQVAKHLNVSRSTFYRMVEMGEAPPWVDMPGGRRRWKPEELERWINKHRVRL